VLQHRDSIRSLAAAFVGMCLLAGPAAATESATAKKPPTAKQVDVNSASRAQLKTLRGIGDAEADRIIAARPYLSKAELVTKNVLPEGVFQSIRHDIVAVQHGKPATQPPGPQR
jgi:DNA uptake protein ComE-like DNA-binding protein